MHIPYGFGPFHIIGIGGIGMSAIAEILLAQGFAVQGSDMNDNANVQRLRNNGIKIFIGHKASNIDGAQFVVISTAVKRGNPEFEAALANNITVIRRADMLAELMRQKMTVSVTGTHGKTTTTSLIAHCLEYGRFDPTVINGGIINDWGSNARIGRSNWMVVEADESDGTFARLPTQIGVATNLDPEHLDFYGDFDNLKRHFRQFCHQIPFYGLLVAGTDHPEVRQIVDDIAADQTGRRILTYGENASHDLHLANVRPLGSSMVFDVHIGPRVKGGQRRLTDLTLPVPGRYNAQNAVAAIAVASELGIDDDKIRESLGSFGGVSRRFTHVGQYNNADLYDDYAHHPVEIAAVLKAARQTTRNRVIAILQPHRYSRLSELFDDFARCLTDADLIAVVPVFAAGEQPIPGIDHWQLAERIRQHHAGQVFAFDNDAAVAIFLARHLQSGDLAIGLGAGTISAWMRAMQARLETLTPDELTQAKRIDA